MAWILATHKDVEIRDGTEAVELGEQACRLEEYKVPIYLDTLAAAYAEVGEFKQAVQTAQRALQLARDAGQKKLVREIESRLESYRAKRPWRESFDSEDLGIEKLRE